MTEPPQQEHKEEKQAIVEGDDNVVRLCGFSWSICGYCRGGRSHLVQHDVESSRSYGVLLDKLQVQDYQTLMDRGWRRSGKHLYKPDNLTSCCPALSIRLPVSQFQITKGQRKVWRALHPSPISSHPPPPPSSPKKSHAPLNKTKSPKKGIIDENATKTMAILSEKGVVAWLQYHTAQAVVSWTRNNHITIPNHINLNSSCTYRLRQSQSQSGMQYMLSSSVCAALVGQWRGSGVELDRTALSQHVATSLRKQQTMSDASITNTVSKIESHAKSGHINIWIQLSSSEEIDDVNIPTVELTPPLQSYQTSSSSMGGKKRSASPQEEDEEEITAVVSPGDSKKEKETGASLRETIGNMNVEHSRTTSAPGSSFDKPTSRSQNDDSSAFQKTSKLQKCMESLFRQQRQYSHQKEGNANEEPPYVVTVRSVPAHVSAQDGDVHRLFLKYQNAIHGDEDPLEQQGPNIKSTRKNTSEGPDDEEEDAPFPRHLEAEYEHLEPEQLKKVRTSYSSFYRFLCETPLPSQNLPATNDTTSSSSSSMDFHQHQEEEHGGGQDADCWRVDEDGYDVHIPYGTYHQQYRINGRHLIAVGVVDILPHSLSSVYAFYDPQVSHVLNLGKYTALREIEWVRRAMKFRPSLCYYYLGYYIHSCQKMRYKAEYRPSSLLCPKHNEWVDFEIAKRRLDQDTSLRHYGPLVSDEMEANEEKKDEHLPSMESFIKTMRLDIGSNSTVFLSMLNSHGRNVVDPLVKEFVTEVGRDVSQRCIINLCTS
uniref:arginyltransferase n=1 Tax=Attheya septentrionalis TaxID=420275 RepID=A0A7S2UA06_9STRA|mmetsp:Transcript_16971/g.30735  ORF Transcript_16971/g.30735 Transcript_16971/m.30735 type:complete len:766 (+) Transcript_16971:213-2510(+)|eukprot:CAMPEP_0198306444 /NCGR_PEP_ID=MMETSP1449-20131203/58412_1 /TAXON_ID=420275 /ORGANISM="Attheya septentrionalis, Strain CCMP2084" /LENGTH=765 /DNA_ID=CAMNT_0044008997 /DNA_START=143 /DNA_END=2440 /DNA_ORIENTATION=+